MTFCIHVHSDTETDAGPFLLNKKKNFHDLKFHAHEVAGTASSLIFMIIIINGTKCKD